MQRLTTVVQLHSSGTCRTLAACSWQARVSTMTVPRSAPDGGAARAGAGLVQKGQRERSVKSRIRDEVQPKPFKPLHHKIEPLTSDLQPSILKSSSLEPRTSTIEPTNLEPSTDKPSTDKPARQTCKTTLQAPPRAGAREQARAGDDRLVSAATPPQPPPPHRLSAAQWRGVAMWRRRLRRRGSEE